MNNQVRGEVVGDADGAVSGEVRGEVVGDADGAVSGEVRGEVVGDADGAVSGEVRGEVVGDADGAVSGEVRGEVVGDADGAVSGEVRGAVDGGVAGVSSARDEVMDAYFQALNELTQENPSYREHCRGDEDNIGDNDIGFDAEDDNVGHSADHDYNDYNDYEEDDESLGGELDGDESYSDTDNEWEHLDESGNTVANDLDENSDTDNEWTHLDENAEQLVIIDGEEDVVKIDMFNLHNEDVSKLRFGNLEVAYKFYCWFAKMNGFAVRKGQDVRNKDGVLVQKTFVCNLEGYRKDRRDLTEVTRKRGPKHETRCGCSARLRVHIDIISGLWYITIFSFEHNHYMLTEKHCGLLAAHRKLTKSDQIQIKNYGQAGIKVAQMIGAFANAAGGYDKVGFLKKDLHNQIQRQRKETSSDAKGAVKYLLGLRTKDPLMFVAHTVDACGREVEADFHSQYGNAVLQTPLRSLERSASKQFTHEIFCLVRSVLKKVSLISLCDTQEMASFSIYSVTKYQDEGHVWRVSHSPSNNEFKCSCLRMESIGIPCEHIVAIMVYLDTVEFPTNLVLNRWSKFAKDSIRGNVNDGSHYWDSHLVARHANLVHLSKEVSDLAYKDVDDYKNYLDYLTNEITRLKSKYVGDNGPVNLNGPVEVDNILNPSCARSKGGGPSSNNTTAGRSRRPGTCGGCSQVGHNIRSCPNLAEDGEFPAASSVQSMSVRLSGNNYEGYVNTR
ncbi:unnamed protein product [Trifolium pratense]|uniref:Uncharacterized protein n=1 Tax=Trifolium pratense TaxID=57577 RepID=A0ACB0K7Y8_TRIPR|nr:unnamed protein product [Trifolium pratense]